MPVQKGLETYWVHYEYIYIYIYIYMKCKNKPKFLRKRVLDAFMEDQV